MYSVSAVISGRVPSASKRTMEDNECRFYEQQYPEVDDMVIVNVGDTIYTCCVYQLLF